MLVALLPALLGALAFARAQMSETLCLDTLGGIWSPTSNSCFKKFTDARSAFKSSAMCIDEPVNGKALAELGLRGRLAHIKTEETYDAVGVHMEEMWIGIKIRDPWPDELTYNHWVEGPDLDIQSACITFAPAGDLYRRSHTTQHCTRMRVRLNSPPQEWSDAACNGKAGRLCEYLDETEPTTGDTSACAQETSEFCNVTAAPANSETDVPEGSLIDKNGEGFEPMVCAADGSGVLSPSPTCEATPEAVATLDKITCRINETKMSKANTATIATWASKLHQIGVKGVIGELATLPNFGQRLNQLSPEKQVSLIFDVILDSHPDVARMPEYLAKVQGGDWQNLVQELLGSAEYAERNGELGVAGNGRLGCAGGQSPLMLEGRRRYLLSHEAVTRQHAAAFCEQRNMKLVGEELESEGEQRDIAVDLLRAFRLLDGSRDLYWANVSQGLVRFDAEEDSYAAGLDDSTAMPACHSLHEEIPVEEDRSQADPYSGCASRGGLILTGRCLEIQPRPGILWAKAQSHCRRSGGRLFNPTSKDEVTAMLARMPSDSTDNTFLGGRFSGTLERNKTGTRAWDLVLRDAVAERRAIHMPSLEDPAVETLADFQSSFFPFAVFDDALHNVFYLNHAGQAKRVHMRSHKGRFYCEYEIINSSPPWFAEAEGRGEPAPKVGMSERFVSAWLREAKRSQAETNRSDIPTYGPSRAGWWPETARRGPSPEAPNFPDRIATPREHPTEPRAVFSQRFAQAAVGAWAEGSLTQGFPATITSCTRACMEAGSVCVSVAYEVGRGLCHLSVLRAAEAAALVPTGRDVFSFDRL